MLALTQGELARRANFDQSRVSRAESGAQSPTFSSVERLLRGAGNRLISVPTVRGDVASAAQAIRTALEQKSEALAFRHFIQLSDDLAAEHGAIRVALTITEPERTGVKRWDAALAALAELRLNEESLPKADWVADPDRTLRRAWSLGAGPYTLTPRREQVPREFLARGVWADRDSLESV